MGDEVVFSGWTAGKKIAGHVQHHWFTVSGTRVLELVMLCDRPTGYVGHFANGRMDRCRGAGCGHCAKGIGRQVRYVFGCAEAATGRVGLLEVSESVAETIHGFEGRHHGLRFMWIELSKHTKSNRSRMEVEYVERDCGPSFAKLEAPDVLGALKRTWEVLDQQRNKGRT